MGFMGSIDEISLKEAAYLGAGMGLMSLPFIAAETGLDKLLETKYPEKFTTYSTAISSAGLGATGVGLMYLAQPGGRLPTWAGYLIGAPLLLVSIVKGMDIMRIEVGVGVA